MLTDKQCKILDYFEKRTLEMEKRAPNRPAQFQVIRYPELIFRLYTKNLEGKKHGLFRTKDALATAVDDLTEKGYLDVNSEGYKLGPTWRSTRSDKLVKINKKTGILEMKHLKTFEGYDPEMTMPCCPICHSENCDTVDSVHYECIDCGEQWDEQPPYEEEEDVLAPELTDDELSEYENASDKIETILSNAESIDVDLADQLRFEAEKVESFDEFLKAAEACIQDVKGVDREEAIAILNSLM